MKLYKLTTQEGYTQDRTYWYEGVTHTKKPCNAPRLCSGDVYHAYTNLNLGLLLNPNHADIVNPRMWKCEGDVVVEDWGKVGVFELSVIKELPVPAWYVNETVFKAVSVQFAVLCAEAVLDVFEQEYPNDERPRAAIEAAKEYLNNPTSTARAAADAAADAARAAADAAYAADADAAYAARAAADAAADAARAAADAAADAARAAADAAYAAAYAANALNEINFAELADLAVELVTGRQR